MEGNKHYVRLDESNRIIKGFSDAFEQPQEADKCINENGNRHFELNGLINPSLFNGQGIALYKYDGEAKQRTAEETQAEIEELKLLNSLIPTQEEVAKAEREIETITLLQDLEVI